MAWGRLSLVGLFVLLSPLWNVAPEETASRPGAKDRDGADFRADHPPATQCGSCHSEQLQEWSRSLHARSLTSEGFLKTFGQYLEFLGKQAREDPQAPMACFSCHAPLLRNAEQQVIRQVTDFVLAKELAKLEGFEVGCVACHADGRSVFSGPIGNPRDNPFHVSKFSPSYKEASFCATCHKWNPPSIPCSDVYSDWEVSKAAKQGKTCQSCHMSERSGMAAAGGPVRKIHSHTFPGGRSAVMLQQAVALGLKAAFRKEHLEVTATVRNLAPHRVPDG